MRLGFEYGNPWIAGLFSILGFWGLIGFLSISVLLVYGFVTNKGVEGVAPDSCYGIGICILAFSFYGAYTLRSLILNLRLRHYFKNLTAIAEYQPLNTLAAPEAGYLIDRAWGKAEVDAVICELLLKEKIIVKKSQLTINPSNSAALNYYQTIFINELFQEKQSISLISSDAYSKQSLQTAAAIKQRLIADGYLSENSLQRLFLCLFYISFYVVMALIISTIFAYLTGYKPTTDFDKTYPVTLYECIIAILALFPAGILLVNAFLKNIKYRRNTSIANWRTIAGFKLYLEVVYKGRFIANNTLTVDKNSLFNYFPYAVAFQLEKSSTLLKLLSRS